MTTNQTGRNDPCPCGSGKKFKRCCHSKESDQQAQKQAIDHSNMEGIRVAYQHQQAGRLSQAETIYQQILQRDPRHPDALHLLGLIADQVGKFDIAVDLIQQAVMIKPNFAEAHYNLGNAYNRRGNFEASVHSYKKAIAYKPGFIQAHINLGHAYLHLSKPDMAVSCYQKAISINPEIAELHNNMGCAYKDLGKFDAAIKSFKKAILINPDYVEAHNNLGNVLSRQTQFDVAAENSSDAHLLGSDLAKGHANLGDKPNPQDGMDLAIESLRRAITLRPDYAMAHNNLANALYSRGKFAEAVESFCKAISLKPDYATARLNLGMSLLCLGKFEEGWAYFEARSDKSIRERNTYPPDFSFPEWHGESLIGKSLAIWHEQGLGDQIQFCRYAKSLKDFGATRVTLVSAKPLTNLFKTLTDVDAVLAPEDATSLERHDYWSYLLSLPLYCNTSLNTIPRFVPYLFSDQAIVNTWQNRLGEKGVPRVGLVWSGRAEHQNDVNRSIGLTEFALLVSQKAQFISLHKELREADKKVLLENQGIQFFGDDLKDFSDTAALIELMDVIITVDTAVAHLAGALGKPVWILLPFNPDWRWLLERNDSPWYPTARLFRQTEMGDWKSVIQRVASELEDSLFKLPAIG